MPLSSLIEDAQSTPWETFASRHAKKPAEISAEDWHFVRGAALSKARHFAQAASEFAACAETKGPLGTYALLLRGRALSALKHHAKADACVAPLRTESTEAWIRHEAILLHFAALAAAGQFQAIGQELTREIRRKAPLADEMRLQLDAAALLLGHRRTGETRKLLATVIGRSPNHLAAFDALDLLRTFVSDSVLGESPLPMLRDLAECAAAKGDGELARSWYAALASREPNPADAFKADFASAMTHFRADDFDAAAAAFESLLKRAPDPDRCADALFRLGFCYRNLGRFEDARLLYSSLTCDDPRNRDCVRRQMSLAYTALAAGDVNAAVPLLIEVAAGVGNPSFADDAAFLAEYVPSLRRSPSWGIQAMRRFLDGHPGSPLAPEARFRLIALAAEHGDANLVLNEGDAFLKDFPNSISTVPVRELIARQHSLERRGELGAEMEMILAGQLARGNVFAAARTLERLRALSPAPEVLSRCEERFTRRLRTNPAYALASGTSVGALEPPDDSAALHKAERLIPLGFEDWASRELESLRNSATAASGLVRAWRLARGMANQGAATRLAATLHDRIFGRAGALDWDLLSVDLRFPRGYIDRVRAEARDAGIDPSLLLGIVLQESRFDSKALSPVGARGLTQFMPGTARRLAADLNFTNFQQPCLDVPEFALRFAARYLAQLLHEFGGHAEQAVAAYNGGAHNVRQWLGPIAGPAYSRDRFISMVGFEETRNYVRRVLYNQERYSSLAGESLPDSIPGVEGVSSGLVVE